MSGASERASGQASGPVLTSGLHGILNHCARGKVKAGADPDEVVVVEPSAPTIGYCLGINHGKYVKVHEASLITMARNPGK